MDREQIYEAFDNGLIGLDDIIDISQKDGYNQALEDFYNGLADELLWIRERFGDDAYMEAWCSVGCLQNRLTK